MNQKELNLILEEGEGQFIEFKEKISKDLSKEIVAFANASGGKIYIGISDNKEIKSLKISNSLKSQIQDIANNCDPKIPININIFENIIIVEIKEGNDKPYSSKDGFFMRLGPNSQKMKRKDILKLAMKGGKIRFDEQICVNFDWKDFDEEKFEYYLKLAKISYNLSRDEILRNLKILSDEDLTNAGVLFFAKNPYKYIITSKIRCIQFNDDERIEILDKKEIDRGIIENIEFAINYIKDLVPIKYEIKKLARDEYPEYPEDAYREAIINAIIHFDYFDGTQIAIEKLKNSIIINNKGELLFKKEDFGKKSEPRNRLMADLLSKTEYMEKAGTGIKRIQKVCKNNNNNIEFKFNDSFWVKIESNKFLKNAGINVGISAGISAGIKLTAIQENIIKEINKNPFVSAKEISLILDSDLRTIERNMAKLKKLKLIQRIGSRKKGKWRTKNDS